jgi:hypothetical protein
VLKKKLKFLFKLIRAVMLFRSEFGFWMFLLELPFFGYLATFVGVSLDI